MPIESDRPPTLMTMEELGVLLRLNKASARNFAWRELVKFGAVVKVGSRLMVHAWAVNRWIDQNKIDPKSERAAYAKLKHERTLQKAKDRYKKEGRRGKKKPPQPFGSPRSYDLPKEVPDELQKVE